MRRLEEIKNEYIIELYPNHSFIKDYDSYLEFFASKHPFWFESVNDEISERYAKECSRATLNKSSENALINGSEFSRCGCEINKESITNPDNIVLL